MTRSRRRYLYLYFKRNIRDVSLVSFPQHTGHCLFPSFATIILASLFLQPGGEQERVGEHFFSSPPPESLRLIMNGYEWMI